MRRQLAQRRRRIPGGAILLYHRVAEVPYDPERLAITPELFDRQMAAVAARYEVVALTELARRLRAGEPVSRTVCVTFDDGYADNLHVAAPILERHRLEATVFVATANVARPGEFWWDELKRLVPDAAAYRRTSVALMRASLDERERLMDSLRRAAGDPEAGQAGQPLAVTVDELRRLDAHRCVDLGAHTHDHLLLAVQSEEVQRDQMVRSKTLLEGWLGREVTALAYPYGAPGIAFTRRTRALAREAGFVTIAENFAAPVLPRTAPAALPRLLVGSWEPDRLLGVVDRLIGVR